jgi:Ca-activated chloride channel family protein
MSAEGMSGEWSSGVVGVALGWLGVDTMQHPEVFIAAIGAVALLLISSRWRPPVTLPWPGLLEAEAAAVRRPEIGPLLALGLRGVALASLAGVLAGPMSTRELPPEPGQGLDLVLVLDTSASMGALDVEVESYRRTRLQLARSVVSRFASHRVAVGDRVGLVVFAEQAFTQCPLTSDGGLLDSALGRVGVGVAGQTTALGDALALAVKRASVADSSAQATLESGARVVVLLTDGRSNAGGIPPSVAAELARAAGVRVHTVGIGTGGGEIPMAAPTPTQRGGMRFERHDPDLPALRAIADATGGRFFTARSSVDLAAVYDEIDSLERRQRALPPRMHQGARPESLLALAGGCLLCEIVLARLLRRRLP